MARTPLFRQLVRALRIARHARARGMPVCEAAEAYAAARRRGPSRRAFLQLSAAAAVVPVVGASGCNGSAQGDDPGIAIVGAGMAGLHCAYRLMKAGISPKLYDAAARVGGRMLTDRATFAPQHCELGGELIDSWHETMLDLAQELDIELLDYEEDDPALDDFIAYIDGRQLTSREILEGFAPIAAEVDAALATLTDQDDLFVYYDKPNNGEPLDALSLSAWLDRIGASGPVRTLLEVAYTAEFGLDPHVQNALNLLFLISTDTEDFEIYGASDTRYHPATGSDTYIQRLGDAIGLDRIQLDHRLEALRQDGAGRYILTFRSDARSVDLVASRVVLALPFTLLRDVDLRIELPLVKRIAIHELGMGMNTKLMCGFATRPWRDHGSNGETISDLPYQTTWETSRLQPGAQGIITCFTGGDRAVAMGDGTQKERRDKLLAQLDLVFPGARAQASGEVVRAHWPSHPLTRGSYAAYLVGQYTRMAGAEIERVRNLHFCGEHTSLDAQGYMEGAALTGAMAADEIAADLDIDAAARSGLVASSSPARRILTRARAARTQRRWRRARPR